MAITVKKKQKKNPSISVWFIQFCKKKQKKQTYFQYLDYPLYLTWKLWVIPTLKSSIYDDLW